MMQIVRRVVGGTDALMRAPSLVATAADFKKSVFKTLVKRGTATYESGKQAVDHTRRAQVETAEDLAAEAKAKIAESRKGSAKVTRKKAAAEALTLRWSSRFFGDV
jgi:polyhydroxyalkanoate synthesis regulator phasin